MGVCSSIVDLAEGIGAENNGDCFCFFGRRERSEDGFGSRRELPFKVAYPHPPEFA
jgi:hypothetical protein